MDPRQLFIDSRLSSICVFCGAPATTRDHVPSKVLLDTPYPPNIPVVNSCVECNHSFSTHEEYLACMLECVIQGTSRPNSNFRPKVAKTLKTRPSISERIEHSRKTGPDDRISWSPENERVRAVVLKLARGHIAWELGVLRVDEPIIFRVQPLSMMTGKYREFFEHPEFISKKKDSTSLFPEIGSRAFIAVVTECDTAFESWMIVQEGRYRYLVSQNAGDSVRIVLSEYLACEIIWE